MLVTIFEKVRGSGAGEDSKAEFPRIHKSSKWRDLGAGVVRADGSGFP